VEQPHADGFARLLFGGIDIQVWSAGKNFIAVGVDDPKGEHDDVIVRADEEFAQNLSQGSYRFIERWGFGFWRIWLGRACGNHNEGWLGSGFWRWRFGLRRGGLFG